VLGLLLLFALSAGIAYLGTWPPMATVMSGSMEPTINTGDVVLLKRVTSPPKLGDIIYVRVPETARRRYGYPPQVIHRVFSISPKGEITTKGDARDKPDPFTVRSSTIKAKVAFTIPAAGRAFAFLTSTLGLAWMAGGVFIFLVMPRLERQREIQEGEQQTLAELRAELGTISVELSKLGSTRDVVPGAVDYKLDLLVREAGESKELLLDLNEAIERQAAAPPEACPFRQHGSDHAIAFDRIFAPALSDAPEPEPLKSEPAGSEPVVVTNVVRRRSGGLIGGGLARALRRVGDE
jgi:signal peptidase I